MSEREREILALVATGASNKEIAQRLIISPNTVKVHLRNIFAKIKVTSRTEATLYALRIWLVDVPGNAVTGEETTPVEETNEAPESNPTPEQALIPQPAMAAETITPAQTVIVAPAARGRAWVRPALAATGILGTVALVIILVWLDSRPATLVAATIVPATPVPRWQTKASLPTARTGLAAATYENQIYAIGGEGADGVTGLMERYDPASDQWDTLAAKPLAVADVSAAVIHGLIYVPGGRTSSGTASDVLEVFNPREDTWERRASMPAALSGYAAATLEGQLYVFGGWDGQDYSASVYRYSPTDDRWMELTPMPTARAYGVAGIAGGKIYVIGGRNNSGILNANEEYVPEKESTGEGPWRSRSPLPDPRYLMGSASQTDIIHILGGVGNKAEETLPPLKYIPARDEWQQFEQPAPGAWSGMALTVVERFVHAIGGEQNTSTSALHMTYEAVYTIGIPVVQ